MFLVMSDRQGTPRISRMEQQTDFCITVLVLIVNYHQLLVVVCTKRSSCSKLDSHNRISTAGCSITLQWKMSKSNSKRASLYPFRIQITSIESEIRCRAFCCYWMRRWDCYKKGFRNKTSPLSRTNSAWCFSYACSVNLSVFDQYYTSFVGL